MGLLDRLNVERRMTVAVRPTEARTIGGLPWRPWASADFGGRAAFGIGGPRSPTEATEDQGGVLALSAVYGCVRHLSEGIASLPIVCYRLNPDGTSTRLRTTVLLGDGIANGGPMVSGTLASWLAEATTAALLHGSAFGLITSRSGFAGPDGLGLPSTVAWLPSNHVYVRNSEQRPEDPRTAQVYYMGRLIDQSQLVHLKATSLPGHLEGISPLRHHAMTFAAGRAQQSFARTWFEGGGFPLGYFKNAQEDVNESQSNEIRRRLTDAMRTHQPLVFGADWEYTAVSVPADEAQMITSQQYSATQIAAIFGVPPWRVGGIKGGSLTYTSQIQDAVDELQNTFRPWLVKWEHLLTSMLPANQYARFDADEFLKTDPETRSRIHTAQRATGERTVNELRAGDDMAPLNGGDDPIPGEALVGMLRSTKGIPNEYVGLIKLEADLEADRLKALQQTNPALVGDTGKPPVPLNAEDYLGAQIASGRAAEKALAELRSRGLANARDDWSDE